MKQGVLTFSLLFTATFVQAQTFEAAASSAKSDLDKQRAYFSSLLKIIAVLKIPLAGVLYTL